MPPPGAPRRRNRPLASLLLALLSGCGPDAGDGWQPVPVDRLPALAGGAEPAAPTGPEAPERLLRLALTGEVRGEVEPCGCPNLPYGGFARRSRALDSLRAGPVPLFVVDAGETLVKGIVREAGSEADMARRSRAIADLTAAIGTDVLVPGPSDLLVGGLGPLRALQGRGVRVVSATWTLPGGAQPFPGAAVLERDGVRVAVVGLSAAPVAPETRDLVAGRDPVEATRAALASLSGPLDLVVAVGNLADADADRVAAEVPGVALVLQTAGARHDPPRRTPGAPVVETPARGRYLTLLEVRAASTAGHPADLTPGPAATVGRLLEAMDASRRPGDGAARAAVDAANLAASLEEVGAGRNLVRVEDLPLGEAYDGPAAPAQARLDAFKREALAAATKEAARPTGPGDPPAYATAAACVTCHREQFVRWTYTGHAQALTALIARHEEGNPECLGCHSTGFGEPGGLGGTDPDDVRRLGGVQCESCHGPLRGHPDDGDPPPRPQRPSADTCRTCHDPPNSPDFDYAPYLARVACPTREVEPTP